MPLGQAYLGLGGLERGLGLGLAAGLVRSYRLHKVLIECKSEMWSTGKQVCVAAAPWMAWLVVRLCTPHLYRYNAETGVCPPHGFYLTVANTMAFAAIVYCAVILSKLRRVRLQLDEYDETWKLLVVLVMFAILWVPIRVYVTAADVHAGRVCIALLTMLSVQLPFWLLMWQPVRQFLPARFNRARVRKMVDRPVLLLHDAAVRQELAQYAGKRFSEENLEFYEAVLRRNGCQVLERRRALTMQIINMFVREDAPVSLNLSARVRKEILSTDSDDDALFNDAMNEVTSMVVTGVGAEYLEQMQVDQEKMRTLLERVRRASDTEV